MVMPALFGGFGEPNLGIESFDESYTFGERSLNNEEIKTPFASEAGPLSEKLLGAYLAGLIEGDGSIIVPKEDRNILGKKNYAFVKVCFSIYDKVLAEHLCKSLGGFLRFNSKQTFVEWVIVDFHSLYNLTNLINGFFRTPKVSQFALLVNYINKRIDSLNETPQLLKIGVSQHMNYKRITSLGLDSSPIEANSWLSGFTDADGNFNINVSKRKKANSRLRIALNYRLELTQESKYFASDNDNSNSLFPILNKIATLFCCPVYTRTREIKFKSSLQQNSKYNRIVNTPEKYTRETQGSFINENNVSNGKLYNFAFVMTYSDKSNMLVADYFTKFPLFSNKYHDFMHWLTILNIKVRASHKNKRSLSPEDYHKCIEIKSTQKTESKRMRNWNHLDYFYI
jgi:hypothetical protein